MDSPIISPSKARRDAEQARDWAHVTRWLAEKYAPLPVPRFERNNDVLQSLLVLVAANDVADGEAELLHRARDDELERFIAWQGHAPEDPVHELLSGVEASLGEKGVNALRDWGQASILLGTLRTDSATMRERMLEVEKEEFELAGQLRRVEAVRAYLDRETALLEGVMKSLTEREAEDVTERLQQQTTQYNRDTKLVGMKLLEYKERVAALERVEIAAPPLEAVKADEQEILALQTRVKGQEKQLADFQGLPPNLEAAREEYRQRQKELQSLTRRRDELFDLSLTRSR